MSQKIKLDDKEYDLNELSETAQANLRHIEFINGRIKDLQNNEVLLNRARSGYIEDLKKEILSNKAGIIFDDE